MHEITNLGWFGLHACLLHVDVLQLRALTIIIIYSASSLVCHFFCSDQKTIILHETMSCMNAFVYDFHPGMDPGGVQGVRTPPPPPPFHRNSI